MDNVNLQTAGTGNVGAYQASAGGDRVTQATAQVRSSLSESVINPITQDDLRRVQATLSGLSRDEASAVLAQLSDAELSRLTHEINAWGPGSMDALSAADKQVLINDLARNLDGPQLARMARAFDGNDVIALGQAVADRAAADARAGFVGELAASGQIVAGTRKDGGATRAGTAETEAAATVLASLRGSPREFAGAVAALNDTQLRDVVAAARGDTTVNRFLASDVRSYEADQLKSLQATADSAWRNAAPTDARDVRAASARVQTAINAAIADIPSGERIVLADGGPLRAGIIPSVAESNRAQLVAQARSEFAQQQQRIAQLEALGTPQARALAAQLRQDYHAQQIGSLAADAYHWTNPADRSAPIGYTRASELTDQQLARYGVTREMLAPVNSQFRAELYVPTAENPDPNARPVLSFKGTTPAQGSDWANNFTQGRGQRTDYYDRAMQLAVSVNRSTNGNLELTGHSLGGGMASAAAAVTGRNATTFNASGLHANTAAEFVARQGGSALNASQLHRTVVAYQVDGDILTTLQEASPQIDPTRAEQLGGIVRFAAGVASNPWVQGQAERRVGPIGDWGGLTNAQGNDLLSMPEAAGRHLDLRAIDANGRAPAVAAAQFVGPNGLATRADAILDRLDARNAQARTEAEQIRNDGQLGAGLRAEAHLRGSQINNARLAYAEYQADPVLQAAGGALGESVNRHGMFESSLNARVNTLEGQATALLAAGR